MGTKLEGLIIRVVLGLVMGFTIIQLLTGCVWVWEGTPRIDYMIEEIDRDREIRKDILREMALLYLGRILTRPGRVTLPEPTVEEWCIERRSKYQGDSFCL